VDAQAGLDPCWSQKHYVGFVVTRLKFIFYFLDIKAFQKKRAGKRFFF
jgi:hypothetical protein